MDSIKTTSVIIAIIIAIIALYIAFKTPILRETSSAESPYSLSKFQLWIWTFIICPLFALHWGFHFPAQPYINETSLILLGIAGGVTLVSGLLTQISANRQAELVNKDLKTTITLKTEKTSQGFWIDLLTGDDDKMPVERLQNLIFTFVYVVIYVSFFFSLSITPKDVVGTAVPKLSLMNYITFSNMAYVLMGISSGSYLIGKGMNR